MESANKGWMLASRLSQDYWDGVADFIKFAYANHAYDDRRMILCPCVKCGIVKRVDAETCEWHLISHGFDQTYTCWTKHGEMDTGSTSRSNVERCESPNFDTSTFEADRLQDMADAFEAEFTECPEKFEQMKSDGDKPLYENCTGFTLLSAVLNLYNWKARHGVSDSGFTELLGLLRKMLPPGNELPTKTYEAKKVLRTTCLSYEKIHACPNDCILFRKEYESLTECPMCSSSRYQSNGKSPKKALWYFPIIPRFRRLYSNAIDAKNLRWHADERIQDGMLRHPADSAEWAKFDFDYPEFAEDPRNLRLVLATDGMNPFGMQSSTHSTWPVMLFIYNLPPWLSMKRKYMMLSILISGPRQPGNDIDVYLAPLIEDLKTLWDKGEEVYDAHQKQTFNLKAMLFGTINDFPAYGNLSGYSIKGQHGCPICEEATESIRLKHGMKNSYMGHRRWLKKGHPYRRMRKYFDGQSEDRMAPEPLTGEEVFEKTEQIDCTFGKPFGKYVGKTGWKKRSVFFDLPYWSSLNVRHFLDVMHIEKNVCESLFGTLLHIPGKTKDGINARLDMVEMGIREELAPEKRRTRTFLRPAAFTLSRQEKRSFCEFLASVKVPEGYSSNISSLVSMKDLKLKGLKSHDCHVLMENFIPVAIRGILPDKIRATITKLCFFFKSLCSRVIDPKKLPRLQTRIVQTLCELEMFFPPSFFDIMVHLTVHLVREVQLCGPVYMRWMYPVERKMKYLKGYVKNRSRPEGCIVERYICEEAAEFCADYLKDACDIGLPVSRHEGRTSGQGLVGKKVISISDQQWEQVHLYVLHNSEIIDEYVDIHLDELKREHPNRIQSWYSKEHNKKFTAWLKEYVADKYNVDPTSVPAKIMFLARGPNRHVLSFSSYVVNGYTFYTTEQDVRSKMQNSGVTVIASTMHVSSAKDRNPIYANMSYFGVVEDIWELDYVGFHVPVFGCKWVDNNNALKVDEVGLIQVNLHKQGYKEEPFILASQAKQVFYVSDPANKEWSIVLLSNKIIEDALGVEFTDEDDPFQGSSFEAQFNEDDALYIRHDHNEGIWISRRGKFHHKVSKKTIIVAKKSTQLIKTKKRKRGT